MTFLAHPGVPPDQGGRRRPTSSGMGIHGGTDETSMMLHLAPGAGRHGGRRSATSPSTSPRTGTSRFGGPVVVRLAVQRLRRRRRHRRPRHVGDGRARAPSCSTAPSTAFCDGARARSRRRSSYRAAERRLTGAPTSWRQLARRRRPAVVAHRGARRDRRGRRPERRAGLRPAGAHRRRPRGPRPRRRLDARPRPRRRHRRDRQRRRHPARHRSAARARDDRLAHRHRGHRRALRRQPRRARRARGDRDPRAARHRHDAPDRASPSSPTRRAPASPPTCSAAWCTSAGWRSRRRSTCAAVDDGARLGDELVRIGYAGPLPCPAAAAPARVRRAAHRAGADPRGRGHHDRRRRGGAGDLVDRADDHRPLGPRRHDADAPAARRRRTSPRRSRRSSAISPASTRAARRSRRSAGSTSTPTSSTSCPPAAR